MKLSLINFYPKDTMARYLLSSYVLKAYLDKYLPDDEKVSIDILNYRVDADMSKVCSDIIKRKPDLVGYSSYVWNIEKILKLIQLLRNQWTSVHILGGPEITPSRIESFNDPAIADYYVVSEGEKKLLQLVRFIKEKGTTGQCLKGIARWSEHGVRYEEDSDRIEPLDDIPSVYLNGVIEESLYERQQVFLETQRGCRFRCLYCVYHKNLRSISYYSLERVFQELEFLIVKKNVAALRIIDAIFTSDLDRAKKIVRYLAKLKNEQSVRLPWIYWEFRYDGVDEEFIELTASLKTSQHISNTNAASPLDRPQLYSEMHKGYTVVNSIGIESFSKEALHAVGRPPIDTEKLNAFMSLVKKHNIVLKIDLILGVPLETYQSFFDGLEFFLPYLKDTDHALNIHLMQIIPGCGLEKLCDRYGIRYSKEAPHIVSSTDSFSEQELQKATKICAVLFRVFNSPIRKIFFEAKEKSGQSFLSLTENILKAITESKQFEKTKLVQDEGVDDVYWNEDIFCDIPSQWLIEFLKQNPAK